MSWANQYMGIPFKERGLTRDGADCWGLVRMIMLEQKGIELPDYGEIAPNASMDKVEEIEAAIQGTTWTQIPTGQEKKLDCVLMKGIIKVDGKTHSRPIHIGVVVKPGTLIHLEIEGEVTIVDYRNHHRIKNRVVGFYRAGE